MFIVSIILSFIGATLIAISKIWFRIGEGVISYEKKLEELELAKQRDLGTELKESEFEATQKRQKSAKIDLWRFSFGIVFVLISVMIQIILHLSEEQRIIDAVELERDRWDMNFGRLASISENLGSNLSKSEEMINRIDSISDNTVELFELTEIMNNEMIDVQKSMHETLSKVDWNGEIMQSESLNPKDYIIKLKANINFSDTDFEGVQKKINRTFEDLSIKFLNDSMYSNSVKTFQAEFSKEHNIKYRIRDSISGISISYDSLRNPVSADNAFLAFQDLLKDFKELTFEFRSSKKLENGESIWLKAGVDPKIENRNIYTDYNFKTKELGITAFISDIETSFNFNSLSDLVTSKLRIFLINKNPLSFRKTKLKFEYLWLVNKEHSSQRKYSLVTELLSDTCKFRTGVIGESGVFRVLEIKPRLEFMGN